VYEVFCVWSGVHLSFEQRRELLQAGPVEAELREVVIHDVKHSPHRVALRLQVELLSTAAETRKHASV